MFTFNCHGLPPSSAAQADGGRVATPGICPALHKIGKIAAQTCSIEDRFPTTQARISHQTSNNAWQAPGFFAPCWRRGRPKRGHAAGRVRSVCTRAAARMPTAAITRPRIPESSRTPAMVWRGALSPVSAKSRAEHARLQGRLSFSMHRARSVQQPVPSLVGASGGRRPGTLNGSLVIGKPI
jgi:hypothetical protein